MDWSVVSAEGLHLLQNLTEQEARELEANPNYPPGGNNRGVCWAVPTSEAQTLNKLWKKLEDMFERQKREARVAGTRQRIEMARG